MKFLTSLLSFAVAFSACFSAARPLMAAGDGSDQIFRTGMRALIEQQFETALANGIRLLKQNPKDLDAHLLTAKALIGMGKFEEAFGVTSLALSQGVRTGEVFFLRAQAAYLLGLEKEAGTFLAMYESYELQKNLKRPA